MSFFYSKYSARATTAVVPLASSPAPLAMESPVAEGLDDAQMVVVARENHELLGPLRVVAGQHAHHDPQFKEPHHSAGAYAVGNFSGTVASTTTVAESWGCPGLTAPWRR